jgi:hypothetical protein
MSLSPLTKLQISQPTEFGTLYANPKKDVNDRDEDRDEDKLRLD